MLVRRMGDPPNGWTDGVEPLDPDGLSRTQDMLDQLRSQARQGAGRKGEKMEGPLSRHVVTAVEAAKAYGVTPHTSRHWCTSGRIPREGCRRASGGWLIDAHMLVRRMGDPPNGWPDGVEPLDPSDLVPRNTMQDIVDQLRLEIRAAVDGGGQSDREKGNTGCRTSPA